ncbi:alpha/beta hydrolase [Diaminobutyricibacter tongyongensis]
MAGAGAVPGEMTHQTLGPAGIVSHDTAPQSGIGDAPAGSTRTGLLAAGTLRVLSRLSASDIPSYIESHRAALDAMLVNPPRASDVAALWKLIDPRKQEALVKAAPHVIGNLEGIPYAVRGRANVRDLKQTMAETRENLSNESGKAERLTMKRTLDTLQNITKALARHDGVRRTLIGLDASSDARAAIVIGDLSRAHFISYLVPGMYMSVDEQIVDWAKVGQELYDSQTDWLRRLLGPRGSQATPGVATVAWIGYQTPELMNIGGLDLATQGANNLERSLEGLQSIRQNDPPYVSVFAHSYGSTAALLALQRHSVTIDALALLGSPGSDAQSVAQLSVRDGNVFVGQAPMDPIVHSAFFGSDPGAATYGAQKMGVAGGVDPITEKTLAGSSGHNEYFATGSESMRNLALIGIDMGELVMGGASAGSPTATTASGGSNRIEGSKH